MGGLFFVLTAVYVMANALPDRLAVVMSCAAPYFGRENMLKFGRSMAIGKDAVRDW